MNTKRVEEIYELLGPETFLVPCETNSKIPKVQYKSETLGDTFREAYKRLLTESNIAVYLGNRSNSLVVVDLDREDSVEEFAKAQKIETLVTRGERGCSYWYRIRGDYPDSASIEGKFEFRANNRLSMISGIHPSGKQYRFLNKREPATVRFDEILWPEDWEKPWSLSEEAKATADLGPVFSISSKGVVSIRHITVAELVAIDNDVVFVTDLDEFYLYDPGRGLWVATSDYRLKLLIADWVKRKAEEYSEKAGHSPGERDSFIYALTRVLRSSLLSQICDLLKIRASKPDIFRDRPSAIHTQNKMIVFDACNDFVFHSFDKSFSSRNQISVPYRPQAKATKFLSMINDVIPDPDDRDLLQRYFGLALTGRNSVQIILVLSGLGGVGKGTIVDILNELIGRENVAMLRTHLLEERFELAHFIGKTLLYGADVAPDFLNQRGAAMLKSLTGGDLLNCEIKGGRQALALEGNYNVLITANGRLTVKLQGDAHAWSRRLRIIYFDRPRDSIEQIVDYSKQLVLEEGAGILEWGLGGLRKLNDDLRSGAGFRQTREQERRVESIIAESDSTRLYVSSKIQKSSFPADQLKATDIWDRYLDFCDDEGFSPKAKRIFFTELEKLMKEYHRSSKAKTNGVITYLSVTHTS